MGTCAENGGKSSINGRFAIMFDCQRNRPQAMKPLMEVAENSGFSRGHCENEGMKSCREQFGNGRSLWMSFVQIC